MDKIAQLSGTRHKNFTRNERIFSALHHRLHFLVLPISIPRTNPTVTLTATTSQIRSASLSSIPGGFHDVVACNHMLACHTTTGCHVGRLSPSQGELMSVRMTLGGKQSPARYRAITQRDSNIPLPSGSYRSSDESFEPIEVPPSLRQVALFIGTLIFIAGFGVGFYASVFVLLLSNTR